MASLNIVSLLTLLVAVADSSPIDGPIKIPSECKDKHFCDIQPSYYPQEVFDDYVTTMLQKDFIGFSQYSEDLSFASEEDDEENCSYKESIIQPFIYRTNATAKLVVQTKYFKQTVKQTECKNTGNPCFRGIKPMLDAKCTPTYGTVKLYVYNTHTKIFEYEDATIPVCCSCSMSTF